MSIEVRCPKGHLLKVKSSFAGKTGLCPHCRSKIYVPNPSDSSISEESILDIIGELRPDPSHSSIKSLAEYEESLRHIDESKQAPPSKNCTKCNLAIPSAVTICPHCHTYVGESVILRR